MKTINTNLIAAAVAAIGLTALPAFSGVAQAKDHDKDKDHHDNGKHLGWDKGKGNKHGHWDDQRDHRDWDDRRDHRDSDWQNRQRNTQWHSNTVQHQWTKWHSPSARPSYPSYTSSNWRLHNTRPFGTRASANRAAALRRQLGYRTSVAYDPNRRVYVLREYGQPTSYRTSYRTPTRHLVGTYYHSSQAAAANAMRFAQSKGLSATSTYNSAKRVWIVRTYTR